MLRWLHTAVSWGRVTGMLELLAKTAAEEGRDIVLSMLVVGLIFVGVAVLGDLYKRFSRKSH
jgi:hypothetical protein